jgi:hypothetical protein
MENKRYLRAKQNLSFRLPIQEYFILISAEYVHCCTFKTTQDCVDHSSSNIHEKIHACH